MENKTKSHVKSHYNETDDVCLQTDQLCNNQELVFHFKAEELQPAGCFNTFYLNQPSLHMAGFERSHVCHVPVLSKAAIMFINAVASSI